MATLKRTRVSQPLQAAEFEFTITDDMLNASGVSTVFKAAAGVFDIIPIAAGSRITGGEIVVKTVSNDTGTATIVGRRLGERLRATSAATSIKTAARTALVPTGYVSQGEPIRITLANANGDATTGKVKVAVHFLIEGRGAENIGGSQVKL
jgi:hypothetical protein